jgi:CDGSH-type Zn-finger protein
LSKNQPFYDGSHTGTDVTPLKYTPEKPGEATWCRCKATSNRPFRDRTHARLGDLEPGDPAPEPESEKPSAKPTAEEPTVARIHELARDGLPKLGRHGEMGAMGVPRKDLLHWDDIQVLPAQMARKPLMDDAAVANSVTIGPRAEKPL